MDDFLMEIGMETTKESSNYEVDLEDVKLQKLHLQLLSKFCKLLDYVRAAAVLTTKRAQQVAPGNARALEAARKSEERAVHYFLACAESRYLLYLDHCVATLKGRTFREGFEVLNLVPPWDVAIVMHAHMLSCSPYLSDISRSRWSALREADFRFPLHALCLLDTESFWSHEESEKHWKLCNTGLKYQLWEMDPRSGCDLDLQTSQNHICISCMGKIDFSVSGYVSYRLYGATVHHERCGDISSFDEECRFWLRRDITAILKGSRAGQDAVGRLKSGVVGKNDYEEIRERLMSMNITKSSFWSHVCDPSKFSWPEITLPKRMTQMLSQREKIPTEQDSRPTDMCSHYRDTMCPDISLNLVESVVRCEIVFRVLIREHARREVDLFDPSYMDQTYYLFLEGYMSTSKFNLPMGMEIIWLTHLLTPEMYNNWCEATLGRLHSHSPFHEIYSKESFSARISSLFPDNPKLDTRIGDRCYMPPNMGRTRIDSAFDEFECTEAYFVLSFPIPDTEMRKYIASRALDRRIRAGDRPCFHSRLKDDIDFQAPDPMLSDLETFPLMIETVTIDTINHMARTKADANDALLLRDVVPSNKVKYIFRQLTLELVLEVLLLEDASHSAKEKAWAAVKENIDLSQIGIVAWTYEVKQHFPRLYHRIKNMIKGSTDFSEILEHYRYQMPICDICAEETVSEHLINDPITSVCDHEATICTVCLARSIESDLMDRGWDKITCPYCSAVLTYATIAKFAQPGIVDKYDRFMVAAASKDDPNFRSCLRPSCHGMQIHERGAEEPLMTCIICEHKMCFLHERPWHEGQTCREYDISRIKAEHAHEEEATVTAMATLSKRCPGKDCGAPIEKNDGCDHMTCSRCKHEFCWQCLADFKPIRRDGNAGHNATCPYHSDNLPPMALLNPAAFLPRAGTGRRP